jgi:DNA-directed RNA polymerase II subunit RPB2
MVCASFFSDKTLVSQQIASFNEFVTNTMQELVDENSTLILDQNMQYTGKDTDETRRFEIKFGQIYLSRPTQTEADGSVAPMFPNEARLRNLTYSAPLYVDIEKSVMKHVQGEYDQVTGEPVWEPIEENTGDPDQATVKKVYIGKVPIMLQSDFCILQPQDEASLFELNECPFDMGGYFIINGSEKVLIAQERTAANQVYVFAKAPPSAVTYQAEIRSAVEKGGKTISQLMIKMMAAKQSSDVGLAISR